MMVILTTTTTMMIVKMMLMKMMFCRTTVKISFPDLRNELFVNILGYKEPNLIHLWRCKVFSLGQ